MQVERESKRAVAPTEFDDDALVNLLSELDVRREEPASADEAPPDRSSGPPRVSVLIADDSSFMRYGLCKLLADHGYQVLEADGGIRAIELYRNERPDAVLLDITMPDMDGLSALRQIRLLNPDARVAMVTGMGQQSIVMQAIRCGAMDFVIKPFEPDRVLAAVQKLIATKV